MGVSESDRGKRMRLLRAIAVGNVYGLIYQFDNTQPNTNESVCVCGQESGRRLCVCVCVSLRVFSLLISCSRLCA